MIGLDLIPVDFNTIVKENSVAKLKWFVKGKELDIVLVPLGMGLLLAYHVWLVFTIVKNPKRTVIGLNIESRHKWIHCLMAVSILPLFSFCLILLVLLSIFDWFTLKLESFETFYQCSFLFSVE